MARVNYDMIAHLYDEPLRDYATDPHLLAFFEAHPDLSPAQARILDVGCGTGKQLSADWAHFPESTLVGLDPFRGMLRIAQQRCPGVAWVQGSGTAMPFPAASFHYVTNQFSYAHIPDKPRFIREVARILMPGGRFALTNIDPWGMPDWHLYRFFPEAHALDLQDFLPVERLVSLLTEAGFVRVESFRTNQASPQSLHAFHAYASQRHKSSQFMAIPDPAYEAGLARIEQAIAAAGSGPAEVPSQLAIVTLVALRAGELASSTRS